MFWGKDLILQCCSMEGVVRPYALLSAEILMMMMMLMVMEGVVA